MIAVHASRVFIMDETKGASPTETKVERYAPPTKNIVDKALAAGNLATLVAGFKTAGLYETLGGKGPFTVFAPTDEAFSRLPAGALDLLLKDTRKLKAILTYHIVAGYVSFRHLKSGEIKTLQGSSLTALITGSEAEVNGAHVVQADLDATNGIIHAIDAVIMPKNWQLLAAA
jgi:uncharacterized surface protein with fasciclin (FAS1) repeats